MGLTKSLFQQTKYILCFTDFEGIFDSKAHTKTDKILTPNLQLWTLGWFQEERTDELISQVLGNFLLIKTLHKHQSVVGHQG